MPSPARKPATTVVVEVKSTPEFIEITRCQTTWSTSALAPLNATIIARSHAIEMEAGRLIGVRSVPVDGGRISARSGCRVA